MKKSLNILLIILVALVIFSGCKERTELTGPQPVSGEADFSRFVAIGNSLTAGYQSSALFESGQIYSFGNLIAQQVNTEYIQPLISDPGIGGQIKVVSIDPFLTMQEPVMGGSPENLNYPAPYNNMGIPGIVLADVMNATSTENSYSHSALIDVVLRGQGTQFQQATALNPTMISLWIGNNDVLGFATSGGVQPPAPTDAQTFGYLYGLLADGLAATGAKVVVGNIPDVTVIPFFTTVGPMFVQQLSGTPVQGFYYQKHSEYSGSLAAISQLADYSMFFTLISQSYLMYFGQPTGKFYRDHNVDISLLIAAGILDTTKGFGIDAHNPIPDALVLDADEIQTAEQSINAFNSIIAAAVNKYPSQFALADIHSLLDHIRASDGNGGTSFCGINFCTTFVTGGLFSLDGVHPTSQGNAIIANEFLKTINSKFNANYKLVNVANIPGSLSFAKSMPLNLFSKGAYLNPKLYENILF